MLTPNAGMDAPDPRDWKRSDLFGEVKNLPGKVFLADGVEIQNQSLSDKTKMACGTYSFGHATNTHNRKSGGPIVDCKDLWINGFVPRCKPKYDKLGVNPITDGSRKQDHMKYMREQGYNTGYVLITSVQEAKESLFEKRVIQTGSNKIDWVKTRANNNVAAGNSGSGHFFIIVGYDDDKEWFICMNSYGQRAYDNGFFYLRYEDFGLLYSAHQIIDKEDVSLWTRKKMKIMQRIRALKNAGKKYTRDSDLRVFRWI